MGIIMDQDTAEGRGGLMPAPLFGDAARPAPVETTPSEPAGRQETNAPSETAGETGESRNPPDTKEGPRRDAAGRFAPKVDGAQEAAGSPPVQQQETPQSVPVSVHVAERKKLQERIAALEAQIARQSPQQAMPQGQPAPPRQPIQPPPADLMFSDPDRYHAGMIQYQHSLAAAMQAQWQMQQFAQAEAFARRQWPDFDEVLEVLEQERARNPAFGQTLALELSRSPDPAGVAYQRGKELLARQRWQPIMQEHSDPEAFIAAEVERRLAERVQQPASSSSSSALPPASLASVRSVGAPRAVNTYAGPKPLFPSGRRA
jgi:uncharacterized small protein (DUF1192 family)